MKFITIQSVQSNRNLKSIINYIIIKKSNNIEINDVRSLRGTYHSEHNLPKSKIFHIDIKPE